MIGMHIVIYQIMNIYHVDSHIYGQWYSHVFLKLLYLSIFEMKFKNRYISINIFCMLNFFAWVDVTEHLQDFFVPCPSLQFLISHSNEKLHVGIFVISPSLHLYAILIKTLISRVLGLLHRKQQLRTAREGSRRRWWNSWSRTRRWSCCRAGSPGERPSSSAPSTTGRGTGLTATAWWPESRNTLRR